MLARRCLLAFVAVAAVACAGCHRKVEPYDASEQPQQPDLSKIFPPGSERAMGAPAEMPPSPEEMMGGAPAVAGTAPESAGPPIRGTIQLAAGARLPAGATLFVIARTGEAGPPTAVLRLQPAPPFPFEFRLGPEDRMIAALPWEGPFVLTARIDLDGNATTRDVGGLEGRAPSAAMPGDTGLAIRLGPAE